MKKLICASLLMLFAVPCFADFPLALNARIEQQWNKLEFPEDHGTKQYDSDVLASLLPSLEIRPETYLFGRVSYPIRSKLPSYAVGLEFRIYNSGE